MSISFDNATELTQIILTSFGLPTGFFEAVLSAVKLGKGIAEDNQKSEKEKFIETLKNNIQSALASENVSIDVYENLKNTFQNHFDLQELMNHYNNRDKLYDSMMNRIYSNKEYATDPSAEAYRRSLAQIMNAVYSHLKLFNVTSETTIATLQELHSYGKVIEEYKSILDQINYKGTFAEFIDKQTLPSRVVKNAFSYLNPNIGFYGRTEEMKFIKQFLYSPGIQVWAITGPGGCGKSKLALHIAMKYQFNFKPIWLKKEIFEEIRHFTSYHYNIPILFICDYASSNEDALEDLIERMIVNGCDAKFLLLERASSWYSRFFNKHRYANEHKYWEEPINLSDSFFKESEYYCILNDYAKLKGTIISDIDKDTIITKAEELSMNSTQRMKSVRCLFLLLIADAFLKEPDNLMHLDEFAIFSNYIEHSKELLYLNFPEELVDTGYKILAFATACGGINWEDSIIPSIDKMILKVSDMLCEKADKIRDFFNQLSEMESNDTTINPLYPDIIGEFLFLIEYNNLFLNKTKIEWLQFIINVDDTFISRCLVDWYDRGKMLWKYMLREEQIYAEIFSNAILETTNFDQACEFLEHIEQHYLYKENMSVLKYYLTAIIHMGNIADYKEKQECQKRIKGIVIQICKADVEQDICFDIYNLMGVIYFNFNDYSKALDFYNKALLKLKKVQDNFYSFNYAIIYKHIGEVHKSIGSFTKSLEYFKKALSIFKKILDDNHPLTAIIYDLIGYIYKVKGNTTKALLFYNKALSIFENVLGSTNPYTAMSHNNIGELYRVMGDYTKALKFHKKALSIRIESLGTEHPVTAISYNNIGLVLNENGNAIEALKFHHKALAIKEKYFGLEHPTTATSYNNIGEVYRVMRNYDEALKFYNMDLEISKKILGTNHPSTAISFYNIGIVYLEKKDYHRALNYMKIARRIFAEKLGEKHSHTNDCNTWIKLMDGLLNPNH